METTVTDDRQHYRMPAEWEPHSATWIAWPHPRPGEEGHPHWPHTFRKKRIPRFWAIMVDHLCEAEMIHVLAHDDLIRDEIVTTLDSQREGLSRHPNVCIHRVANNWPWIRDSGGIIVVDDNGGRCIIDWEFNGWGYGKWEYGFDNEIPEHMSLITGIPRREVSMILEGGSIDVNGRGSLLTTTACLLNPNRNMPNELRTQADIEAALLHHLGITHTIWLGDGIGGDDASGHIDDITRFIGSSTVLTMIEEDSNDENFAPLRKNCEILKQSRDQDGRQLTVVEIPMPKPQFYRNQRMPLSYANFYIGNEVVLVPIFNDPNDNLALDVLSAAFPTRKIIDVFATDLVWGLGSFHCLTQQEPAGK